MADLESLVPFDASFDTIERAIHVLDESELVYFEACEEAVDTATTGSFINLHKAAVTHAKAYKMSLAPLVYDTVLEEFGNISHQLMVEKQEKRIRELNCLLGAKVLEPTLPNVLFPFVDTTSERHKSEYLDKKLSIYLISSAIFAETVEIDTELFINKICA